MPTGTFSATGQSDWFHIRKGAPITIDMGASTTVVLEERMANGTALPIETITADYGKGWNRQAATVRLNCTVYGSSTPYEFG